jgi:hypothetical protein
VILAGATSEETFSLKKTLEIYSSVALDLTMRGQVYGDWALLSGIIKGYTITNVVDSIRCPTLVTQWQDDSCFTTQGQQLFDLLKVKNKAFHESTDAGGAQYHCGPMAPEVANEVCWDELDGVFGR